MFIELHGPKSQAPLMFCDNMSAGYLVDVVYFILEQNIKKLIFTLEGEKSLRVNYWLNALLVKNK